MNGSGGTRAGGLPTSGGRMRGGPSVRMDAGVPCYVARGVDNVPMKRKGTEALDVGYTLCRIITRPRSDE